MSNKKKNESSVAGGIAGFQIPLGIKKRKKKVDELLSTHPDINELHVLSYFSSLSESATADAEKKLDECGIDSTADDVKDYIIRMLVSNKIKEVVRKKPGGGGYVLYSPNKGKKNKAKDVGNFPTKLGAKRAELQRFPPKDPQKLARLRKQIDRLMKDPKKAAEKERAAAKEKHESIKLTTESTLRKVDFMHRRIIAKVIKESLFREEKTGSEWDDYISKLSKQALSDDKKFKKHQDSIEKKTRAVLQDAFNSINKAVKKDVKLKNFGVKKNEEKKKTYLAFSATFSNVAVEPIYIYVDNGVPKIEVSDTARVALTKTDPDTAKLFRAELVTVQENVLDKVDSLIDAIGSRDKYLTKVESEVDSFVAGLSPLQISLLKQLLVKKYRKL